MVSNGLLFFRTTSRNNPKPRASRGDTPYTATKKPAGCGAGQDNFNLYKNLYAVCSMQYAVCSMQYAVCSMQYAVCSMQYNFNTFH
ncbi:hypothetical protein HMPREF9123_0508 [Neisseria bacilliformis ATCC BAA-1200]|uniref:Uncharacterized protein n=1 Tax=Neisseria bacilliformis ATCC BAA-1200 TaxID=888742 RepID=F2B9V4_9NEIS|nr:hypothetical protein HMPREF9123_0508 [Neisseria bacilliformis ATCC BAA-1200]